MKRVLCMAQESCTLPEIRAQAKAGRHGTHEAHGRTIEVDRGCAGRAQATGFIPWPDVQKDAMSGRRKTP